MQEVTVTKLVEIIGQKEIEVTILRETINKLQEELNAVRKKDSTIGDTDQSVSKC